MNMQKPANNTGMLGERLARRFLESRGLAFHAANIRSPFGEIDLIMKDLPQNELVFVEVKTRRGTAFGTPEQAVTAQKRSKLHALVTWYTARERWKGQVRFDVVGILLREQSEPVITHLLYVS